MGKHNKRTMFAWIAVVSALLLIYSGYHLLDYYMDYRNEVALKKELVNLRSDESGTSATENSAEGGDGAQGLAQKPKQERTTQQMAAFYDVMKAGNEDYVCWITLPETEIDYPVLQRDNSFYLNHDYKGEKNRHGSIFIDEKCDQNGPVVLVHGHHMKDGTMFGGLKQYKDEEWRQMHREVVLEFADGQRKYRVFAAALVDLTQEGSLAFEKIPETEEAKALYIEGLQDASFWLDDDVETEGASVLVLSTCEYGTDDQRLLVAAVRTE